MTRTLALAALVAVLLGGCGGDDEPEPTAGKGTPTTAGDASTFESADVGFTFAYPHDWQESEEGGKVLGAVSPTGEERNGIKVRETAPQELEFNSYSAQIHAQFEDQLSTKVDMRTETIGDIDFGIMEWQAKGLHSVSYFFTASGKTWQLECLSTAEHRDDVTAACEQAVSSIEPG